jgi:hypothetical protein
LVHAHGDLVNAFGQAGDGFGEGEEFSGEDARAHGIQQLRIFVQDAEQVIDVVEGSHWVHRPG